MQQLLQNISQCTICAAHLPHGCRPVMTASAGSRILLIGQAPGRKVHESGIPWDDKSGDNLREWLGVDKATFYNPDMFALVPMGFCYPGTGKSGDLPPRPECAPQWHAPLLEAMEQVQLTLLVGQYAQKYYLKDQNRSTLTETVQYYRQYLPQYMPLPHPSPRNNIWQKKNPWFKQELLPDLQTRVQEVLSSITD